MLTFFAGEGISAAIHAPPSNVRKQWKKRSGTQKIAFPFNIVLKLAKRNGIAASFVKIVTAPKGYALLVNSEFSLVQCLAPRGGRVLSIGEGKG